MNAKHWLFAATLAASTALAGMHMANAQGANPQAGGAVKPSEPQADAPAPPKPSTSGVVRPPNTDPGMTVPPPQSGTATVIPPPGTPGNNPNIIPK